MGNDLSESSSLPYPDRRGWVLTAGAVEILLGCGCLLLAAIIAMSPLRAAHRPEARLQPPIASVVLTAGIYLLFAAGFFVAGAGSVLRKNWARIMMLVGSGIWLVFGIIGALATLLILPRIMEMQRAGSPGGIHRAIALTVSTQVFLGILLPLAFLVFYTRKSVKATFLPRSATAAGEPAPAETPSAGFPIPLLVPVIIEALGVTGVFYMLSVPALPAFGFIIHGWKAVAIALAYSAFSGIAAWLIYKRRLAGWNIAFFKALLGGSSVAVTLSAHNATQMLFETFWKPQQAQVLQWFPQFMHAVLIGSLVWVGVYVLFLIYARKFFSPTPTADSAPA